MTGLFDLLNPAHWITEGLIVAVSAVISVEGWILEQLTSAITLIVNWQQVANNPIVASAWALARDLTNLFFIVGLVVISFATIFKVTGVLSGYYYKTALPRLLFAAILINLSLGLSETVVLVSNRVTTILSGIMGSGLASLTTRMGTSNLLTSPLVVTDIAPASRDLGLNFKDKAPDGSSLDTWLAIKENRTKEEEEAFQKCLKEGDPNNNFVTTKEDSWARWAKEKLGGKEVLKSMGTCVQELASKRRGERDVSFAERVVVETKATVEAVGERMVAPTDTSQRFVLLASSLFSALMLVMVILSLGAAVIFFAFRVIAIWVLMFTSAFAFGLCWIREADFLKKWWTMLLGWSAFGPLYLLVLIFGMMFLSRQGELMTSVAASAGAQGLASQLLTTVFFYMFAVIVFVGGLMFALDSAFAAAVKSTPLIGKAAAGAGAFSAVAWSQAFGRRAAAVTGIPATAQARFEKIQQVYRERRPEILRPTTDAERLASARRRLGVRGGAQEEYQLGAKRITGERSSLESGMKAIIDKNGAPDKARQLAFLKSRMNSGNRDVAIAAREMLMDQGALNLAQVKETQRLYPAGIAQAEFRRKVTEELPDKDPETAFQYEWEATGSKPADRDKILQKFYGRVMNNPGAFAKLNPTYFADPAKVANMKSAVDLMYPVGPAGSQEQKRRERFKGNLQKAAASDKTKLDVVNRQLF